MRTLTLGLLLAFASSAVAQTTTYKVRNGDSDWSLARRYWITVKKLKTLNPGVNLDILRDGQTIHVPVASAKVSSLAKTASLTSTSSASKTAKSSITTHKISGDDNDWTLARRFGVSPRQIRLLNPDINWSRLRPGTKVHVPAGSSVASKATSPKIHSAYAKIDGDAVKIRRKGGVHAEVVTVVERDVLAKVVYRDGNWYKLRFPKGTEGWVRGDLLKSAQTPKSETRVARRHRDEDEDAPRTRRKRKTYVASRRTRGHREEAMGDLGADDSLLQKARAMAGVRYQWGAASRSGTDCSGFTTQVYRSQGVRLPRTSSEQASVGKGVPKGDMKAGDLVFFHTGRGRRVTHVGIYMGKGKFIHASSGGGKVQVNSLSDGYYSNRFVTARRVRSSKSAK